MTTTPRHVVGDPFIGATLDERYRLDGLIGRGGMASVYRGEDLALERQVAVKVFAAGAEGLDDAKRRASEIALLASLSHRALVRLYDASHDDATGCEFLVMELVDGRDLRETLRLGPIGPADAADLLADLAEALHVIHGRGIVHRDVKPANVLLEPAHLPSRTWNAKLADFGIARLIDDARLTGTGLLVGTPGYLSPEQVTGADPGPAADVYALGLLLLEARTGTTAFPGPAAESAGARLMRDPVVPTALGDDWVALLRSMTAREPGERPTALEVAVAASALDVTERADAGATAATVAFAQSAGTPTVAAADVASPEVADAPTKRMPTSPDGGAGDDDPTRVLDAPGAAGPEPVSADAAGPEPRAAAGPEPSKRSVRPVRVGVVVLLVAAAAALLWILISPLTAPPATAPEPLPSVPGELGVHLEQLDEAVQP
ncbi:serine/threonine-protein kinase [Agromyces sp. PvR057]|uniref:protein kinase domain-containing protein n=1 Tax=Agromyces sp. PvR057 TaxID=3156403 RepID=UPI000E250B52